MLNGDLDTGFKRKKKIDKIKVLMKKKNLKTNNLLSLFIGALTLLPSCSDLMFWETDDIRISQELEISDFNQINIGNLFDIELIQDSQEYVIATGSHGQLDELRVQKKDKILYLKHDYSSLTKNFKRIKLEIHFKTLNSLMVKAPSNIISQGVITLNDFIIDIAAEAQLVEMDIELNCDYLFFHTYGSVVGGYKLRGKCPDIRYRINGTTNIMASNLINQSVLIEQNSIGEVHLYAENKITAIIYNSGNIYYKGNPKTIEIKRIQINNQNPSGKLIPE